MVKPKEGAIVVPTAMTVILATSNEVANYLFEDQPYSSLITHCQRSAAANNVDDLRETISRYPKDELFTLLAFSTGSKSRPGGQATYAGGKVDPVGPNDVPFDKRSEAGKRRLEMLTAIREHVEETGLFPLGLRPIGHRIHAPIVTRSGVKIYSVQTFLATKSFRQATSVDYRRLGINETKSTGTFSRWVRVAEMEKLKKMFLPDVIRVTKWALKVHQQSSKKGGLGKPIFVDHRALYSPKRTIKWGAQKAKVKTNRNRLK